MSMKRGKKIVAVGICAGMAVSLLSSSFNAEQASLSSQSRQKESVDEKSDLQASATDFVETSDTGINDIDAFKSLITFMPESTQNNEPVLLSETILKSGQCGDNITYKVTSDGTLTLSGSGAMYTYEYDWDDYKTNCPWGAYKNVIKKIVIEDGITSISQYSFYFFTNLTEVTIPSSVTSIGKEAFHWCKNVTQVFIDGIESWCQIDFEGSNSNPIQYGAYFYVNGIKTTQIEVPEGITEIKPRTFFRASTLAESITPITSVKLPSTVTVIGESAFFHNYLKSITIPDQLISIGTSAFVGNSFQSITIPDGVQHIGTAAFAECKNLKEVKVPDSVTELGDRVFGSCTSLTKVILPEGLKSIGDSMFERCTSLTQLTIPDTVLEIGNSAFYECSNLSSIELPKAITKIGVVAFEQCTSLKKIVLPTELTAIEDELFSGCKSLSEVVISDKVTSIGTRAFEQCTSLSNVTLPDSVKSIGTYAFNGCSLIKQVIIPNGVAELSDYTFSNCSGMEQITIPDSVTKIGQNVFYKCTALKNITIPDSVKTIGAGVFSGCEKAESIILPSGIVTIPQNAFLSCSSLKEIDIPESVTTVEKYAFKYCTGLTEITVPQNVTELQDYAFQNCTKLEMVKFAGDAPKIDAHAFEGVTATCYFPAGNASYTADITTEDFGGDLIWTYEGEGEDKDKYKCGENLTWSLSEDGKLKISGSGAMYDYSISEFKYAPWYEQRNSIVSIEIDDNVTYIGAYAFYWCNSLTDQEPVLPKKLTGIGQGAFQKSAIVSIEIPKGVVHIGKEAFSECSGLGKVSLPSTLTEIPERMFYDSHCLRKVTFSKGLQIIGDYAFANCYELRSVSIPEGVTAIGECAFRGCGPSRTMGAYYSCSSFTHVTLPSTLKSIGKQAFWYCQSLETINIPDGITRIEEQTFGYCYQLRSIIFPAGIKYIGKEAFLCNQLLKTITFSWGVPEIDSKAFDGGYTNKRDVTATCYYPSNNSAWTSNMFQNYGGDLTWIAKEMVKPPEGNESGESGSGGSENGNGSDSNGSNSSGSDSNGSNSGGNESGETIELGYQAHSLTLNGDIGVNFYLELNDKIKNDDSSVVEMRVGSELLKTIKVSDAVKAGTTPVTDSNGETHQCYKFTCNVNAKQMTDTIEATLKTSIGTWKDTYSVQEYADQAQNTTDTSLKNLMNAMLTYGGYAQKLFAYNTDKLAGKELGDISGVSADQLEDYKYTKTGNEDQLSVYGFSLILKEKTTVRAYFKLESGSIDDYTFTVDGETVVPQETNGLYYIEINDIAAQDLDLAHTLCAGNITITNYSALSYVRTAFNYENTAENTKNVMAALYLYWQAAEQFFNK